ncbi:sporulation histidine kinase inhibitor Sda [Oceanobacillus rekensis]|uniref:sporulation histidine kinase inhibitor Sda n=1 Tax=Oceanobacillus rekensis TaxID=937927 RepID=UPI000B4450AA|nr:sporulation histidine kinase inhibitor Sda [Oceanobacillus rekensis]
MGNLSDKLLIQSYKEALGMNLNKDFLSLLETELANRNLLSNVKVQINLADKLGEGEEK